MAPVTTDADGQALVPTVIGPYEVAGTSGSPPYTLAGSVLNLSVKKASATVDLRPEMATTLAMNLANDFIIKAKDANGIEADPVTLTVRANLEPRAGDNVPAFRTSNIPHRYSGSTRESGNCRGLGLHNGRRNGSDHLGIYASS